MSDEETGGKSIIDPKYKDSMKGATDFVGEMMEEAALETGIGAKEAVEEVKDEEGNVTTKGQAATKGKSQWDLDKLFDLADSNGIDTSKYREGEYSGSYIGRMRMTISNMLRARARKRGGLYNLDGEIVGAPDDFKGLQDPLTETMDGEKIVREKGGKSTADDNDDNDDDE